METGSKIIFMGTPEFAVPALEAVHQKYGLCAVVTTPDKPKGRGQSMQPSAVKIKAEELSIPLFQPVSLKDEEFLSSIAAIEPDIIIVIAFRILPAALYNLARIGAFNIHASLLPKYRGAAPINWAIIKGENVTGLTSFLLRETVDTGDMLLQEKVVIPPMSTAGDLHDMMMPLAAEMAVKTTGLLLSGSYVSRPQDASQSSPAPKLFREKCRLDWNSNPVEILNFIHGVSPVPGAWTLLDGLRLKILRAELSNNIINLEPGEYSITSERMNIGCNGGILSVKELQYEGKKPLKIIDFLRGFRKNISGRFE